MTDDSQKAPLGDQIKKAGVLAGFAAWALAMGAMGLVLLGFLLIFLFIVGVVVYVAWQVSWVIGLGVTLVVLYVVGSFVTGEKI
ncbi:hypothetical protein ACFZAG_11185 [Streptomyces sp. NPDC012403]|uniref:hypothetical protein n=1 Tax=unclassified Streptomyces TaxID=2593676 RepID=UPI0036F12FDD